MKKLRNEEMKKLNFKLHSEMLNLTLMKIIPNILVSCQVMKLKDQPFFL